MKYFVKICKTVKIQSIFSTLCSAVAAVVVEAAAAVALLVKNGLRTTSLGQRQQTCTPWSSSTSILRARAAGQTARNVARYPYYY